MVSGPSLSREDLVPVGCRFENPASKRAHYGEMGPARPLPPDRFPIGGLFLADDHLPAAISETL